ncbi:hypothetical protein ASPWEDRAFT_44265 [Aspergillus wentii DTO 134E9]|uniref:ribonuclease T1 n=1 Tax=Aspergillus wentii DTO 134E9 TaxID=1073089 RepID=A0A1L9RB97_ASPWE|nr:uncharacterized protein ASPWEDRAFT_44265 [Aspergillus wentii DTO 134E9]KAI9934768.1 hypothetical protein MW887_000385 [Aspergillus wentii]OJJ32195.1 hypothetical protein ASPWEDRAFT_44265 [Aspergillus wentii DTO 134E9]
MKLFQTVIFTLSVVGLATAVPTHSTLFRRTISDVPSLGVDCGGQRFNQTQIQTAAQRGVYDTTGPDGPQPAGYPQEFDNKEHLDFPNCDKDLIEFPILANGKVFGGGKPRKYRVVYQTTSKDDAKYCGLMFHRTANATTYTKCHDIKK